MRKLISILLVLILSTALLLPAEATTGAFLFQNYDVEGSTVTCYGLPLSDGGELAVSYGSEKIADATLSSIGQESVPVTVYFLVDAANSLSSEVMQQQLDVLTLVSSYMGSEDTMVLATIDDTFSEGPLLTDKDARQAAINAIGRKNAWQTKLFSGIEAAVDSLSGSTAFHTNRFLVVLTDGHDEGIDKVDVDPLQAKIADAHIPVFSLVLGSGKGQATTKDLEALTKCSQASLGGRVYQLATENISAARAAESLWSTIQATSVIRFAPGSLNTEKDAQFLVRYDYAGTRYEDTLLVRAVDLSGMEPVAETTEATEETEDPETTEPAEEEEKGSGISLIIGGAAILVLAIVLITVACLNKPKKPIAEEAPVETFASDVPETDPLPYDTDDIDFTIQPNEFPRSVGQTQPVEQAVHVNMIALMHPDIICDFSMAENAETTLGRDNRSSVVLNAADRKLSGIHAAFLWDGVHLLIRDKGSTNGTFVSGTPCASEAWYLMENGATVQLGGYEYRVIYQKNATSGL